MDKLRMEQEKQQTRKEKNIDRPNFDQHVPQPLCA